MLQILRIAGDSLTPKYKEGDFVLVAKIPFLFPIKIGDVIVFRKQPWGTLIKRVETIRQGGHAFWVVGTHPNSTDSRLFGEVEMNEVVGKVIFHKPLSNAP